jgi:hypothetical protein
MRMRENGPRVRLSTAAPAAGQAAFALSPPVPAEGLFPNFFGELQMALPGESAQPPVRRHVLGDPASRLHRAPSDQPRRYERVVMADRDCGPARAFCVRTCYGRYFPVRSPA